MTRLSVAESMITLVKDFQNMPFFQFPTGFALRTKFYTGHQVATQYIKISLKSNIEMHYI